MTADERAAIKAVLDSYARSLYESDGRYLDRCAGCGGEREGWTLGCLTCASRHNNRPNHSRPDWYRSRADEARHYGIVKRRAAQQITIDRRSDATRTARIR